MATLIVSNEEMEDIIHIGKSSEESGLLIKCLSETITNDAKEQKDGFLGMLLVTLAASMLRNMLAGKAKTPGCKANIPGWEVMTAGEGVISTSERTVRAGQDF